MNQRNNNISRLKGVSLFSSAGIAETYLKDVGVDIIVANELIPERANLYSNVHEGCEMIVGDILEQSIFDEIIRKSQNIDFLIATPPCQGMSIAGKNRTYAEMLNDKRNHLVFKIIDFINIKEPNYILIENVPNFLKVQLPFRKELRTLMEILNILYGNTYSIEAKVLNTAEYGVAQRRKRAVIKMSKRNLKWEWPSKEKEISLKDAIGHLPSLEAGEKSKILWHFARKHSKEHILWMKNTPTGKSAFENEKYYPQKSNGEKIKSYMTTYRRIKWNEPAPTITMRNDAISSQLNVHPGKKLQDGTYSDARVLSPLELMLLSSLPENWNIPEDTPEMLIRKCIGECIPPLLIKKIVSQIYQ